MAVYTNPSPDQELINGDKVSFTYTGSYHTLNLKAGKYIFTCSGASGGSYTYWPGGKGTKITGTIELSKNTTIYAYTGQAGSATSGSFNGCLTRGGTMEGGCSSGGGASDIRLVSGVWNDTSSLRSRIMTAAGGGGASNYRDGSLGAAGGNGGALTGSNGQYGGNIVNNAGGGAQTGGGNAGGTAGFGSAGSFGVGGSGHASWGASGGGGYYGGGGGGYSTAGVGSGAGGSSYISGHTGCNAIKEDGTHTGQPIHYSGLLFTGTSMEAGINTGAGLIEIVVIDMKREPETYTNPPQSQVLLPGDKANFTYSGSYRAFDLRKGTYQIECYGAAGGSGTLAGKGAYTKGTIQLDDTLTIYIYIGGRNVNSITGGWNGGGNAVVKDACGGGGATDIRLLSGAWDNTASLRSRIMVAGAGGGGAAGSYASNGAWGGNGGFYGGSGGSMSGLTGGNGGTQTSGGAAVTNGAYTSQAGSLGKGGNGASNDNAAGGGAGYYGGSGAARAASTASAGGGAGGSSFISSHPGCNAIREDGSHTGQSIHYSDLLFSDTVINDGVRLGEGYATITALTAIENKDDIFAGQSILQIISANGRNAEFPGYHTLSVTANKITYKYDSQIIVINSDTVLDTNPEWGDATADQTMLVVVINGNLTINSGVNVAPRARKKGFTLFVRGAITNYGTISMTARGAIAIGQNVYLWQNSDNSYEVVPAVGAAGAANQSSVNDGPRVGIAGADGINRQTGGGASGGTVVGSSGNPSSTSGRGAAGTSYSGGSGGGGQASTSTANHADAGADNGGRGGDARTTSGGTTYRAGGGAGNPGGQGRQDNSAFPTANGRDGTGGLLIIFGITLFNAGTIASEGSLGGDPASLGAWSSAGGSSGGGSINIFCGILLARGTIRANGGAQVPGAPAGARGGNGCVTITEIKFSTLVADAVPTKREIKYNQITCDLMPGALQDGIIKSFDVAISEDNMNKYNLKDLLLKPILNDPNNIAPLNSLRYINLSDSIKLPVNIGLSHLLLDDGEIRMLRIIVNYEMAKTLLTYFTFYYLAHWKGNYIIGTDIYAFKPIDILQPRYVTFGAAVRDEYYDFSLYYSRDDGVSFNRQSGVYHLTADMTGMDNADIVRCILSVKDTNFYKNGVFDGKAIIKAH